jgi:hypothetical protein
MGTKKTRSDAVFGDLTHVVGDLWKRPIDLRFLGQLWTVALMVDIDPTTGIERNQVLAYEAFRANTDAVIVAAEDAPFRCFRSTAGRPSASASVRRPFPTSRGRLLRIR